MDDCKVSVKVFFRWAVLASVALWIVADACCAPNTFYGPVRVMRSTIAPGMPDTSVTILTTAYDAPKKRVAIGYNQPLDSGQKVFVRHIMDYGKGFQYLVTGDLYRESEQKCTMYPLPDQWTKGACIPANATKSEPFYMGHQRGQYERPMDAVAFTQVQGSRTAKVMVTEDKCGPVGEVMYDTADPGSTRVITRLYVNQSVGYDNDFYFTLPNITCVIDLNPPKMTAWQRLGLFGWLLGL